MKRKHNYGRSAACCRMSEDQGGSDMAYSLGTGRRSSVLRAYRLCQKYESVGELTSSATDCSFASAGTPLRAG